MACALADWPGTSHEGWLSGIAYDPARQLAAVAGNNPYGLDIQMILVDLKQGKEPVSITWVVGAVI